MTESDDRIRRLLVESLDAELADRLDVPSAESQAAARTDDQAGAGTPTRTRRSWLMPAAAAAAVVVVAAGALALVHEVSSPDPSGNAGSTYGMRVVCTATGSGDVSADRSALVARAGKLAGAGDVTSVVDGKTITLTIPGVKTRAVQTLCDSTTLDLRPLIAPAALNAGGSRAKPLKGLGFPVPSSETAFDSLTAKQQRKLLAALKTSNCAPDHAAGPVIACDSGSSGYGTGIAALLGAPILGSSQIQDAQALGPSPSAQSAEWTVLLTFTSDGKRAFGAFTEAHNLNGSTAEPSPLTCGAPSASCSDFIAFEVNGRIISLPVTQSPIAGGVVQIAGSFTESSAKSLAARLRGGALPVPMRLMLTTTTQ